MSSKTAAQVFGVGSPPASGTARDLFARARVQTGTSKQKTNFYAGWKRKEGPQTLRITSKACKTCGGVITSITRYTCAACHFKGWWNGY